MEEKGAYVDRRHKRTDIVALISDYYTKEPDPEESSQLVAFGTSGHRGSSLTKSFNEAHIVAVAQAVAEYRKSAGITGPLFVGADTHALSEPAVRTCVEVLVAAGVQVVLQESFAPTPTPVVSFTILEHNRRYGEKGLADGIVITPSHNPPEDGGIKYDPPRGGPASPEATKKIQDRANAILKDGWRNVKRVPFERALLQGKSSGNIAFCDFAMPYVRALSSVVDMDAVARASLHVGVDPMGGAGIFYWDVIADVYGLKGLEIVNPVLDPTFSFMPPDHDGKIRMDCSSPCAMANLLHLKDKFDIAFGNDTDYDRHGIVTPSGLMPPNAYLAVSTWHLFSTRTDWGADVSVGKTLVSSSVVDWVTAGLGRKVYEVPVGFKWFVDGLLEGKLGFCGEESAGASFLRRDGCVWTTDKDGIIMDLLAVEILATTGKNPSELYLELTQKYGASWYARTDTPSSSAQKKAVSSLEAKDVKASVLAGYPITEILSHARGNDAPIGGIKVLSEGGWFAVRPSGTEDLCKVYAESFKGGDHLEQIQKEANELVAGVL